MAATLAALLGRIPCGYATCICAVRTPDQIIVGADSLWAVVESARTGSVRKLRPLDARTLFGMSGVTGSDLEGEIFDQIRDIFETVTARMPSGADDLILLDKQVAHWLTRFLKRHHMRAEDLPWPPEGDIKAVAEVGYYRMDEAGPQMRTSKFFIPTRLWRGRVNVIKQDRCPPQCNPDGITEWGIGVCNETLRASSRRIVSDPNAPLADQVFEYISWIVDTDPERRCGPPVNIARLSRAGIEWKGE